MGERVAVTSMLERMGLDNAAATHAVNVEHLDALDKFKSLNKDRVKSLCRAMCSPGEGHAGVTVPGSAEYNIEVVHHITNNWWRCGREGDFGPANIVLNPRTLFDSAEMQMKLEDGWNNDKVEFIPLSNKDVEERFLARTL